ncbi:17905_t:CDS:2 [Cetraspora pellucida]|uniref:17905_t:CDS:1 n=1 Tax=Cetraspora pellucida TaxID=1433469 RepID=A0A9N9EZA1_9GLOM|nr:17905_t:CDS:2 [Cetraspora pellucida]
MLHSSNNESPEVDSSLLVVPESVLTRIYNITEVELELLETLLKDANIEKYELLLPTDKFSNTFSLKCITSSHCPYCEQEYSNKDPHDSENINPSLKLVTDKTILDQKNKLLISEKLDQFRISDSNNYFICEDLLRICISKKKFTHNKAYSAIQAIIAYLVKHTINIIEHGGEVVKLHFLIDKAVTKNLIHYDEIDFLLYPLNVISLKTNFFNLFLKFLAKSVKDINLEIMNPIFWHVKNKPRSILVLKSTLQQCEKNIITDFIDDKVLGPNLYYATSDLGKILEKFNSIIQAKKLIIMNKISMSSGKWHRFNGHLKFLITERKVSIECKGLETLKINNFSRFMVTSNQNALLKIEAGDAHIVCFNISAYCRSNIAYFDRLGEILNHPDALEVVMSYLFSHNLLKWSLQNFPITKIKTDKIIKQLSNPICFIIQYIKLWSKNQIKKPISENLYQDYFTWCGNEDEDQINNNKFGGNIKKFSNVFQPETLTNKSTDILVFNVPEFRTSESEKIKLIPLSTNYIRKSKDSTSILPITNIIQALFDFIIDRLEFLVALLSKSTNISLSPEITDVESVDNKLKPSPKINESVDNKSETSSDLFTNDEPEFSNEVSS